MKNWIYINSNRIIDILCLSAALDHAKQKWSLVRTTGVTQYLLHHPNVNEVGFPTPDDNVVIISLNEIGGFYDKVEYILNQINEEVPEDLGNFEVHCNVEHPNLLERIRNEKYSILLLTMSGERPMDLFFIDETCRLISNSGFKFASLGELIIPCVRGTADFRGLLNEVEILASLEHAPFVMTNDPSITEFCRAKKIKVFHLQQSETTLSCNNLPMTSPNHLVNMILKHYHNE